MEVDVDQLFQVAPPNVAANAFEKKRKAALSHQNLKTKNGRAKLLCVSVDHHVFSPTRLQETLQFQRVLNHPAFKSDPEATIVDHLKNSFA